MESSPTMIGAFTAAFMSLIGVVVWALKQQLGQSQKIIEQTIPQQQKMFVDQMDKLSQVFREQMDKQASLFLQEAAKERDFFRTQVEFIQESFIHAHTEIVKWVKANADKIEETTDKVEDAQHILQEHTRRLDSIQDLLSAMTMSGTVRRRPEPRRDRPEGESTQPKTEGPAA